MGVRASLFVFGFRLVSGHPTSVLFPTQWAHKTTKTLSTTRTNIRLFLGESLVLQATVLLKATVTKTSKASLAYIQKVLGASIVHWSPLLLNMLSFQSRDFLLKPDLLRAISDLGFEHPSEIVSSLTNAIITPAVSDPQGLNGGVVTPNREAQVSKASERRDLGEGRSASHDNQWWTLFKGYRPVNSETPSWGGSGRALKRATLSKINRPNILLFWLVSTSFNVIFSPQPVIQLDLWQIASLSANLPALGSDINNGVTLSYHIFSPSEHRVFCASFFSVMAKQRKVSTYQQLIGI